mgnify:CR=1 FL=1
MPIIGNNGRAFLHGLSDFWLRFFKDLGDIETTYEGMSVMLGQTYLNLLSDVLNTAVVDTPLFKQEYYRLITIREDQVTLVDRGVPGLETWSVATEQLYGKLPYLQNKVFAPTAGYEDPIDYSIEPYGIRFKLDPTEPVLDGFAVRDLTVAVTGSFTSPAIPDWVAAGVKKGDVLVANRALAYDISASPDPDPPGTVRYVVVKVETDRLLLKAGGTLPELLTAFNWRVERRLTTGLFATGLPDSASLFDGVFTATTALRVKELALWAVDAEYDDFRLYTVYGHYFGQKEASSEPYRAFVRGLMQLYVFGPILDRIESALNVMADLPVIRDDGEVLLGYDSGLDASSAQGGSDATLSGGSTLTAVSAVFNPADVGTFVRLSNATNPINNNLFTITAYISPTSVTLNTILLVSESGVTWLHDHKNGSVAGSIFTAVSAAFTEQDIGGFVQITDAANASNVGIFEVLGLSSSTSVILDTPLPFIVESGMSWEFSRTDTQVVTTTREDYVFPRRIPMRTDVVDPANINLLTFRTFDVMTTAAVVTDYVRDPTWWFNKTLPTTIIDRGLASDRVMSPVLLPNVVGEQGAFVIGDPGFYIGADEDGIIPANPLQPIHHHRACFILMDRFLKTHYWSVTLDQNIDLSGGLISEMQRVLDDLKPADSTIYFNPFTEFRDTITINESILSPRPKIAIDPDYFNQIDNTWTVGSAWRIGDTWKYSTTSGGVVLANAGPAVDYIAVVVGGLDPGFQTIEAPAYTFTPIAVLATEPIGYYISRPLHVRTY